jgi:hypothetical protein
MVQFQRNLIKYFIARKTLICLASKLKVFADIKLHAKKNCLTTG